jgi:hypothetical protein
MAVTERWRVSRREHRSAGNDNLAGITHDGLPFPRDRVPHATIRHDTPRYTCGVQGKFSKWMFYPTAKTPGMFTTPHVLINAFYLSSSGWNMVTTAPCEAGAESPHNDIEELINYVAREAVPRA